MILRKEHVVFGGTLALLALLFYLSSGAAPVTRGGTRAGDPPLFEHHPAPRVDLALAEVRALDEIDRDVFAPPRDTRPLPPLEMQQPPLPQLTGLTPPPVPALDARLFSKFLRSDTTATPTPGLFQSADGDGASAAELEELSSETGGGASGAQATAPLELTPDERAALVESWKRLYDWIRLDQAQPLFGQIRNADRYGIHVRERANEAIAFVEVRPETGLERFPGQKPARYDRARVTEFGFADTASNHIQLERRRFVGDIGPSQYANLLAFADECVALRLAAREALGVAEEMYRRAQSVDADDPTPRLGLARCYEAGFQFEKAYDEYQALLAKYAHRPEVHVRLAELEARLRLFGSAEARFRHAEQIGGRTLWRVEWPYGRFLFERGRYDEALARLREARKYEPNEASDAKTRAAIRTDLGVALVATGALDDALQTFEQALQADGADQRALAGKLSALRLGAKGTPPAAGTQGQDAGFELLCARALSDIAAKNWIAARDGLLRAAGTDPLRAPQAWRGLAWLAEITGYPEEALRWCEQSLEGDPTDPWALYQHGRLLAQRDDVQGARDAFVGALDRELDFADALVALGMLSHRTGNFGAAERYYERALSLEPKRPEVHALRGLNHIELGDLGAARDNFDAALASDPLQPLGRAGQAWTTYRGGDSEKAISQFAELNDDRRSLPETDPYRVFARAQMARIQEHESKVLWTDAFERLVLKNDWDVEEAAGPVASLAEGALHIEGVFGQNGQSRVFRQYAAQEFVAIELDVELGTANNAKVGLFLSKERRVGTGQYQVQSKLGIARRRDGGLVVLLMDTATAEENWEDVPPVGGAWWPLDKSVRLRIEKIGEGNEAVGRISIDGITVREGFKLPRLAASTSDVRVGVFVESMTGLAAKVAVDDVEVIKRVRR